MQFNSKMGYSGNEQDYQLIKASLNELKKSNNQNEEILRYLTNILPNPTGLVTLNNAQDTVKSVKAQLANKNLIPQPYVTSSGSEIKGITWTVNEDGSVTANGTASGESTFVVTNYNNLIKIAGKTVTLSGCPSGGSLKSYSIWVGYEGKSFEDFGNGITKTPDANISSVQLRIAAGTTVNNLTFRPQLELGTTATAYTPYVSDLTAVRVSRCGKNLFDISSSSGFEGEYSGLYPDINGNEINVYSSSDMSGSLLLGTFPKGTYTINLDTSTEKTLMIQYGESVSDLTRVDDSDFNSSHTFSISDTRKLWLTTFFSQGKSVTFTDIQLETGNTVTDYEPYKSQTYTPTATGEVKDITVLTPTTNIINDKGLLFTKVIGDDFSYIS